VASGAIEVDGGLLPQRLSGIGDALEQVIAEHRPEAVSVESVFHGRNAKSALMLGHARGVALLCAARQRLPVFEYTAGQIKQATTGRGRADKQQVQCMVRVVLGCRQEMSLDTSDALAAAICHVQVTTSSAAQLLRGSACGTQGDLR
jgi:crossover junction endodeoxyribonuclease RuvC